MTPPPDAAAHDSIIGFTAYFSRRFLQALYAFAPADCVVVMVTGKTKRRGAPCSGSLVQCAPNSCLLHISDVVSCYQCFVSGDSSQFCKKNRAVFLTIKTG